MNTARIEAEFRAANPKSQNLYLREAAVIPGGITHSSRLLAPFPLFIESLSGAHKRDVDGHDYVDYWMGHGANLLGHGHPAVVEAIRRQLERGLHSGGENEAAVEWAELICRLVPSVEKVRFCASGGEATQMAIRVARAFTGKARIVKFEYGFHGWHDAVAVGIVPPFHEAWAAGIPDPVAGLTALLPFNDLATVERTLESDPDIAAVILEPAGAFNDTVPVDPEFLRGLRDVTRRQGVVLIFDEVVTGFRYAPGGAQEYFGVTPDMTTLGKIVGGGAPVGVVGGRDEIMQVLAPRQAGENRPYVPQPGTWNANPVAAAAGLATLRLIEDGELITAAAERADQLRSEINRLFHHHGVEGGAYGRSSIWKTYLGPTPAILEDDYSHTRLDGERLRAAWGPMSPSMRLSMLLHGVDTMNSGGFMSAVHDRTDLDRTLSAFDATISVLAAAEPSLRE